MSDLIVSWLNDEVQLSKKVTSFENDFANGYLFGELLSKYNQQLNFQLFSDRDLRNDKINNFKYLEPTFKTLRIQFNAKIADSIIKKEKGIALRTLYSLKMALEKVHNPADIKTFDDTGKLNTIVPLKQIRPLRDKFDTMEAQLFSKRLNQLNKAQKEIDLEKKLEKFEQARIINEQRAIEKEREEKERDRQIQDERRKIELNKLQRNITFMEDFQAKGWAEHEKNQARKQEREQREREFEYMTETKRRERILQGERLERQEVLDELDNFEKNAEKLGIEIEHDPDNPKKMERSNFVVGSATLMKLKDKTIKSDLARKERDKRRRKMIVDQARAQRDIEIKKRENILLEKLQQQSKQENEIAYEVWRAIQCKEVIIENRNLRNEGYRRKKEDQTLLAQAKEEHLLEQIIAENQRDFDQKMYRQRELNIYQLSENRLNNYKTCTDVFSYIFEIAELCFQHQQDNDTLDLDPRFWRDCCNLFTEDKTLVPKTTFRHPDATENLSTEPSNEIQQSAEELALAELSDYLNGLGAWKPVHKFDLPKDEEDITYIPNEPINNFNLGQLVANVLDMKYPQKQPRVLPADIPNYLPLKMLCLGYDFSGRKTLCNFLKEKYDIQVLHFNEILKEAFEKSDNMLLNGSQDAPLEDEEQNQEGENSKSFSSLRDIGIQMKQYLARGEDIPDELYINAVIAKIREFYPALTHEQFLDKLRDLRGPLPEIAITEREGENNEEGQEAQENEEQYQEDSGLDLPETDRAIQRKINYTQGWILTGYPNNYEQLKSLERALSGFITLDEQEDSEADVRKTRAEIVVKAPAKNIIPRKLIRGGIDAAIILDITKEECLRRALGRRIDPTTGIVYHLEDNPPPVDQSPLIERLVNINDPENSEASLIDKLTRDDKNRKDIENWLKMFGIDEAQINCLQKFDGFGNREDIHGVVEEHLNKVLEFKMMEFERMLEEVNQQEKKRQEEEEERERQEKEDARMIVVDLQVILQEIQQLQDNRIANLTIPPELLNVLTSFWDVVQENYIKSTTEVFSQIKKQRNFISVRIGELQRRFLDIIQRNDDKMLIVLKFQKEYNEFVEENPDMIEDNDTKEELHQRVEDLNQQLWEIIENKKDEASEERKQIMNSGYIEDEMDLFLVNIQKLFQAEIDRYFGCIQIVQDYYHALEGKDLIEPPENLLFDIIKSDNLPPIEDAEGSEPFPRIELLYKNAIKILNGEEVEDPAAVKDPKAKGKAPPKKEEPKKGGKKGQEVVQEEEKKELTPLEKELKQTINTEKAIMRYRLYVIKSLAINRIKELREKANTLYTKLEDWLSYSIKAENDAVSELALLLGDAIERQAKVQNELQLYYVDVVNSSKYLNFLTPPIIPLPPMELKQPNRFTISQLKGLLQQLYSLVQPNGIIDSQKLLQFLIQRTTNSLSRDEMPEEWRAKDFKAYQKIIKNLDSGSQGYISLKVFASYLCLLSTQLPKEEDVLEYQTTLSNHSENGWISREEFVNIRSFFDVSESSPHTEQNSLPFMRVNMIKDLLFDINKDNEKDLLNVTEYIRTITAYNFGVVKDSPIKLDTIESPGKSPGKSPGRKPKKAPKKEVIKSYSNALFD